jgi:hypothetical protein
MLTGNGVSEDAYVYSGVSISWPCFTRSVERVVFNGQVVVQQSGIPDSFDVTLEWDVNKGLSYRGGCRRVQTRAGPLISCPIHPVPSAPRPNALFLAHTNAHIQLALLLHTHHTCT